MKLAPVILAGTLVAAACHREEEEDENRLNYWRTEIAIVGRGSVTSVVAGFACASEGAHQIGDCGPRLVTFHERRPPLLHATGAPGWRLDHWESRTRQLDGRITGRTGPMPDGRFYLNGFGYSDTGALESVTAVFVRGVEGYDEVNRDTAEPRPAL